MTDIPATWKRICGLSMDRTSVGAVWLAQDRKAKLISVYGEYSVALPALPILADALNTRCGKDADTPAWIPVAFDIRAFGRHEQEGATIGHRLLDLGVPIGGGRYDEEAGAEEMRKALMTGKMLVEPDMKRWLSEYDLFTRDEKTGKLPAKGFHLMRATGLALMFDPEEWVSENKMESDRGGPEPGVGSRSLITGY